MAANVRVPPAVSSVTLVTTGVLAPINNIISGMTPAEQTDITSPYSWGMTPNIITTTNLATGAVNLRVPLSITSITINGNVYPATNAGPFSYLTNVAAVDANLFIAGSRQRHVSFELVNA